MESTPARQFTIRDMAILIVLVASSIASVEKVDPDIDVRQGLPIPTILSKSVLASYEYMYRILIPWAPGILLMRLAHPRPSGVRLWRQPGFVASMAATVATGLELVHSYVSYRCRSKDETFRDYFWFITHDEIKITVFGAWIILIISRRWRSEASWIDRLGRGVGILWVVMHVSAPIRWYLH